MWSFSPPWTLVPAPLGLPGSVEAPAHLPICGVPCAASHCVSFSCSTIDMIHPCPDLKCPSSLVICWTIQQVAYTTKFRARQNLVGFFMFRDYAGIPCT